MKSKAKLMARRRADLKAAGLVKVELWVPVASVDTVKKLDQRDSVKKGLSPAPLDTL